MVINKPFPPSSYFYSGFTFPNSDQSFLLAEERALQELINSKESRTGIHWNVDDIRNIVTAKHLCSCRNPIVMSFKVITKNNHFNIISIASIPLHLSHLPLASLMASAIQINK